MKRWRARRQHGSLWRSAGDFRCNPGLFPLVFVANFAAPALSRNRPHLEQQDNWQPFGGAWEIVDGSMRNNSDERGAKSMNGSTGLKDYLVEADVQLLGQYGDAGLIIRATNEEQGVDAYDGYYAGLRDLDNTLILGRAGYGWSEYQARRYASCLCAAVVSPEVSGLWMQHRRVRHFGFRADHHRCHARAALYSVGPFWFEVLSDWRTVAERASAGRHLPGRAGHCRRCENPAGRSGPNRRTHGKTAD